MDKLKIAITTYTLSHGGVGNFIIDLAEFLKNESHDVEIICTDSPGSWYYRIEETGIKGKSFNFGMLGWIPFGRIIHAAIIGKYLKKRNFDLVINNHSFFVHVSGSYYRPGTKLMTVIHNQLPQMVKSESLSRPDIVVCVSPKIFEQAIAYKTTNRVLTILNGAKFPANFMKEINYSENRVFNILFVGRVEDRQKAVFILPQIVSRLAEKKVNVKLTIVGTGPDENQLKKMVEEKGLSQFIDFKGLVAAKEVVGYYQANDILLLPSNFEGLPLTVIEAMGNGCVPVASNLPASTDLCVKNGINGYLLKPGDAEAFVEKIAFLANNIDILQKMSVESIKMAHAEFSQTRAYHTYLEEIDKLFVDNQSGTSDVTKFGYPFKIWKELFPFHMIMEYKKLFNKLKV